MSEKEISNFPQSLGSFNVRTKQVSVPPTPHNCYEFVLRTEEGAESAEKYNFFMPNDPLLFFQRCLEVHVIQNQFSNWGYGERYDQNKYFRGENAAATSFTWLDDYPYSYNYECTNRLTNYTIFFYDEKSQKFEIFVDIPVSFQKTFRKESLAFFSAIDKQADKEEALTPKDYENYRCFVQSLIEKELFELNICVSPVEKSARPFKV